MKKETLRKLTDPNYIELVIISQDGLDVDFEYTQHGVYQCCQKTKEEIAKEIGLNYSDNRFEFMDGNTPNYEFDPKINGISIDEFEYTEKEILEYIKKALN